MRKKKEEKKSFQILILDKRKNSNHPKYWFKASEKK